MSRALLPTLLLTLLIAPASLAGERSEEPAPKFRSLQLVLLMANPDKPEIPEAEVMRYQEQHLAHLTRMGEEGKMLAAGPFSDQDDPSLRGLCLYDVGSLEEARKLAESDPAVKAGRMKVQVMTFWFLEEALDFPWSARVLAEAAAKRGEAG